MVLRAGVMSPDAIVRAATRTFEFYGVNGISTMAVVDTTVRNACRDERIIGCRHIRLSSFGRLRRAGFALLATFEHPHFTLVLAQLTTREVIRRALHRYLDAA